MKISTFETPVDIGLPEKLFIYYIITVILLLLWCGNNFNVPSDCSAL